MNTKRTMQKASLLLIFLPLLLLSGCGQQSALDYNDALVSYTKSCLVAEVALREAMASSDAPATQTTLEDSKTICKKSLDVVTELGDFDKDDSLQSAVLTLLNTENEYLTILESTLSFSTDENWTDEQEIAYLALQGQLTVLRERAMDQSETIVSTQKAFAQTHNFDVNDDNSIGSDT